MADTILIEVAGTTEEIQIIVEDNSENITVMVSDVIGQAGGGTMRTNYTGVGNEGPTLTLTGLTNKEILLFYKGTAKLTETNVPPNPNQYRYTNNIGQFEFGNDIEFEQEIEILWKNI